MVIAKQFKHIHIEYATIARKILVVEIAFYTI